MGGAGVQHFVGLAVRARRGAAKEKIVALPAFRRAEVFHKLPVGEGHGIVSGQEKHVGREGVQNGIKPLSFGLKSLFQALMPVALHLQFGSDFSKFGGLFFPPLLPFLPRLLPLFPVPL